MACGGYRVADGDFANGFFREADDRLDVVTNRRRVAREEILGPVVCFHQIQNGRRRDPDGQRSIYGLAGGV